jgi:hypothetical protein
MRTTQREVVILDGGENALPVVQERYRRLGIEDGRGLRHYGTWLGDVLPPGSTPMIEYVRDTDPKPMLVVDSLIAFLTADENDSGVVRGFMRQCRLLASLGACVVIIHHSGKADSAKKYRGSSDIKAAVDVAFEVEAVGNPMRLQGIVLKAFKSRFATRQTIPLRFDGCRFHADEQPDGRPTAESVEEQLQHLLIAHPGIQTSVFESLAGSKGLGRDRARRFLSAGRRQGLIKFQIGLKNAQRHTWVGPPVGVESSSQDYRHQKGSYPRN